MVGVRGREDRQEEELPGIYDLLVERSWAAGATTRSSLETASVHVAGSRKNQQQDRVGVSICTIGQTAQYTTRSTEVENVALLEVVDVHCHYERFSRGRSHPGQAGNGAHNDEEHGSVEVVCMMPAPEPGAEYPRCLD